MPQTLTKKQKALFDQLFKEGELIFSTGPQGVSVNLCGHFKIRSYKKSLEDRLDVGNGTDHVHVNWNSLKNYDFEVFKGEGLINFYSEEGLLFKFYKPSGPFEKSKYKDLKI